MFMIMFVLDETTHLDEILNAWTKIGVTGATVVESTGLHRRLKHLPMRYAYGESPFKEEGNITVFVVVEDEDMVNKCMESIEKVVGDLCEPGTGVFTAWPLMITKGIHRKDKNRSGDDLG